MPAIDTFDWFKDAVWMQANDEIKQFLQERRQYLLTIRNENERRRLIDEIMSQVKAAMKPQRG